MVSVSHTGRDLTVFAVEFTSWLDHVFAGRGPAEVVNVTTNSANGFSNEMFFVTVYWSKADQTQEMVVRLPPPPEGRLFPEYDLEKQSLVQRVLADNGVPTVLPLAYESDPRWLGTYFMVMPKIEGQSPSDRPRYSDEGWVKELSIERRGRLFDEFLGAMARLHRVDIDLAGLRETAARAAGDGSSLRKDWQWWVNYLGWFAGGADAAQFDHDVSSVQALFNWCDAHWPQSEPPDSLLWGDARPGNVLYDGDGTLVALLDFETISVGPAEVDMGWWMASRLNKFETIPELSGLQSREESYALFAQKLGRPIFDTDWYEVFGAARIGAMICGITSILRRRNLPDFKIPPISPWVYTRMGTQPPAL